MKIKRFFSLLLALIVCISSITMNVFAVEIEIPKVEAVVMRASGRFNMDVPGGTIIKAKTSFPLEAGETVTIKASYTPFSASVDFGLIAPDGYFYYINANDGSFDETIKVDERGNYTFAVQNNSSQKISVSGFVKY